MAHCQQGDRRHQDNAPGRVTDPEHDGWLRQNRQPGKGVAAAPIEAAEAAL
jgi:hypothetical protein